MPTLLTLLLSAVIVLVLAMPSASAGAGLYESPLPQDLATNPDLCAMVPCKEVLPGAETFSPRKGRPTYVEAYRGMGSNRELTGYVFLSTDIVDIPAYSGKPVVTLIGMDTKGIIRGARILRHSEPILLVGIPEAELTKFVMQFVGRFAGDKVEIGKAREHEGYVGVDAISGATVTVIAQNQVMMRSAYEVAKQVGIIQAQPRTPASFTQAQAPMDWASLVKEGSIGRLTVQARDLGLPNSGEPYIDLYFGYLNEPNIGRSILGERGWMRLMADLKQNEHALFIVANGAGSFKGSGFVRGGIYDRIQIAQELDTFTFRDTDYQNLYRIEAQGAPSFSESGVFIVRNAAFSAAYPLRLVFLANRVDRATGTKSFVSFDREYWLPARYLEGGRPKITTPDAAWLAVWKARKAEIVFFVLLLTAASIVYVLRDTLVRRSTRKDKRWVSMPKYIIWGTSIGFVGFYAMCQPSITQVLTWFHSIVFQWRWDLFLSDPLLFIFWWFLIGSIFVWGRGLFCGWLCPYGSLTEIIFKLTHATPLRRFQFQLSQRVHDKLKWTKYGVFAVLLTVSFWSIGTAEQLAEVEPFKTAFLVGVWNRTWPFATYFAILLVLAMFTERPFCKYLCPLGAALAMPTTFRWFGLKRKAECRTCHACQAGCGPQAIADDGSIDQRECLLCLDCQILYYDTHACPPLAQERKYREKQGLPLTPIDDRGYYIPIRPIPMGKQDTGVSA